MCIRDRSCVSSHKSVDTNSYLRKSVILLSPFLIIEQLQTHCLRKSQGIFNSAEIPAAFSIMFNSIHPMFKLVVFVFYVFAVSCSEYVHPFCFVFVNFTMSILNVRKSTLFHKRYRLRIVTNRVWKFNQIRIP